MRLRAIELHGYKSFAARTALQFDSPMTAVVGPNGSGKSNVMDGLRWAIGAGAGRTLRARRAEDVIFSGGRDRAPSGFAEVRVQLDNSDHWLELDAAEVEIVRRVHRDGQSEVRVNGRAARLRDVQDLFRNSGLGAGGFALMSQGLVDEMLRLRPAERRQAIEEVGGVRQHRHQMEESRRRRERAQEHLERARLLREELAPRLKSLERAARRARQVGEIRDQLEAALQGYVRAAAAENEQEVLQRREAAAAATSARAAAEARRAAATDALAAIERETAAARQTVERAAERIRAAQAELQSLEHEQELDQQQRSWLSREAAERSARLEGSRGEAAAVDVASARRALADADAQLTNARTARDQRERARAQAARQHRRAQVEIDETGSRAGRLARRWRANAAQLLLGGTEAAAAEHNARAAQTAAQAAEQALQSAEQALAAVRDRRRQNQQQRTRLTKRIRELESQLAALSRSAADANTLRARVYALTDDHARADAVFGELMDATLHESAEAALAAVRRVVEADAGRAAALESRRADQLIQALLDSVCFAAGESAAVQFAAQGRAAVTPEGVVIRPDGVIQGGGSIPGAARRRRQTVELRAECEATERELRSIPLDSETASQLDAVEQLVARSKVDRDNARAAASEAALRRQTLRRQQAAALGERKRAREESAALRSRLTSAAASASRAADALAALDADEAEQALDLTPLEQQRDAAAAALAEARAQAASAERVRADRERLSALRRELAQVESAIRAREPKLQAAAAIAADTAPHDRAREQLDAWERQRREAGQALEQAQQARLAAERCAVEADAALRESESDRARLAAEAAAEGITLPALQAVPDPAAAPEPGQVTALQERVAKLRNRLQRLGPVDPGAAGEYDAEQARWERMASQIEDLEQTETSLRTAEHDLEQQIERQFRAACRRVDAAFQRYFQLMFRGGSAELVLTEEAAPSDDDAESARARPQLGVEIRARPPGKRVASLGLLSGGERALTAIALLFALLEVRPAPFCILDEVDAALDEANVERFVNALRERAQQTQFVVITHNRRTIEQADSIYGVTMGAAGVSRLLSVRVDQLPAADA